MRWVSEMLHTVALVGLAAVVLLGIVSLLALGWLVWAYVRRWWQWRRRR